jgi:hypothetical protein
VVTDRGNRVGGCAEHGAGDLGVLSSVTQSSYGTVANTDAQPVHLLVAVENDEPVGWCQWYLCEDSPEWAAEVDAAPGDVGVDYAIVELRRVGVGVGDRVRRGAYRAGARGAIWRCGTVADPEAHNAASRRALEKNRFELVGVKVMKSEPTDGPMAI